MPFSMSVMWLILLGVLLLIEVATMGLTTIWFAGGAFLAFLTAAAGGPAWLQIAVFLVISLVLLIFTRPFAVKYMNTKVSKTNVDSVIGEKAIVTKAIDNLKGEGQARIQGLEWSARSADNSNIAQGAVVKVLAVEGVKLIVEEVK